jgi:hypothetical protein
LEHYHLPHYGGVNQICAMLQQLDIIANWSDVRKVYLYTAEEVRSQFATLEAKIKRLPLKQQVLTLTAPSSPIVVVMALMGMPSIGLSSTKDIWQREITMTKFILDSVTRSRLQSGPFL